MDYKKLDKKVLGVGERINIVESILKEDEYIEQGFYNFNNSEPLNKKDKTYTESSTKARYELEALADYILTADLHGSNTINSYKKDVRNKVGQYPVPTYNEENDEYIEFEVSAPYIFDSERSYTKHSLYTIDTKANPYLMQHRNKKDDIAGKVTLRQSDLAISELAELWEQREELRKSPNFKGKSKLLQNLLSQIIAVKLHHQVPYSAKDVIKSIHNHNFYEFNFTKHSNVIELLGINIEEVPHNQLQDMLELTIIRDEVLLQITLTPNQNKLLDLLQGGYRHNEPTDIAEIMDMKKQNIEKMTEAITKKFINKYIELYGASGEDYIEDECRDKCDNIVKVC